MARERERNTATLGIWESRDSKAPNAKVLCVYTGGDNKTGICGERDIFVFGLMKFAYQEIILELYIAESDRGVGVFRVFAFLVRVYFRICSPSSAEQTQQFVYSIIAD